MAASSYYDQPDLKDDKTQVPATSAQQPVLLPNARPDAIDQENNQRGFPQQGYNEQGQSGYPQQGYSEQGSGGYNGQQQQQMNNGMGNHAQTGYNEQSGGGYNGQQQQQMNNGMGNQAQGSMNPNGGNPAVADNRDTLTKWLDKIEHKFGGERFNNPANAEKNRKLNENILKRLKQVGKLVIQRAPRMLMNMAR